MNNKRFNFLLVAICSLSVILGSEARCMDDENEKSSSIEKTGKRVRESGSEDSASNKKKRLNSLEEFNDQDIKHILQTYEREEKKKKEVLESKKQDLERYFGGNNPPKSPEEAYNAGIAYAFNVEEGALEKDQRFKNAILNLKKAADHSNEKASYCLSIFYAMGWGTDDELYSETQKSCIHYLKSASNYSKAQKLYNIYGKMPSLYYEKKGREYKIHQQEFADILKSQKKEHKFEKGIFKAFGWGTSRDMEKAKTCLLGVSGKDREDAYVILYLLVINENIEIPPDFRYPKIEIDILRDTRNYSKSVNIDIDIIKDYNGLLKKKQEIVSEIKTTETEIEQISRIKRTCIFLKDSKSEKPPLEDKSHTTPQKNDEMERGAGYQPQNNSQQMNRKHSSQSTRVVASPNPNNTVLIKPAPLKIILSPQSEAQKKNPPARNDRPHRNQTTTN